MKKKGQPRPPAAGPFVFAAGCWLLVGVAIWWWLRAAGCQRLAPGRWQLVVSYLAASRHRADKRVIAVWLIKHYGNVHVTLKEDRSKLRSGLSIYLGAPRYKRVTSIYLGASRHKRAKI